MVTLLALYNLYFQSFLTNDPEERPVLKSASTMLHKGYHRDIIQSTESRKDLRDAVSEVIAVFESRDIPKKLVVFEGNLNKIQHFILNYIKQLETILQFVRSTSQRYILLHLESIETLIKYLFAHDHQHYGLAPIIRFNNAGN